MKLIKLSQGKFAQVDDNDFELLNRFKWCAVKNSNTFYAVRRPKGTSITIWMHREIMQTPKGLIVDHIDHDGLNNQRNNLRNCTLSQNHRNRTSVNKRRKSIYKGVHTSANFKFTATIGYNKKITHLGTFKTEEEAARAYDIAALKFYGEFANLNFKSKT